MITEESEKETEETVGSQSNGITMELSIGTGIYEGDTNEEGLPDGKGTFSTTISSGDTCTYTGDWVDGHIEGYGIMEWGSGSKYEGDFKNDLRDGEGKYNGADGSIYEGHYFEGKSDGYGKLTDTEGNIYEGEFLQGEFHGEGIMYLTDGSRLEGVFDHGDNFVGIYYDSNGAQYHAVRDANGMARTLLDDFFAEPERQETFAELLNSYQLQELYDYVETYIADEAVSEDDSAYSIIEQIEPLLTYQNTWTVKKDEFDNSYYIVFDGATDISNNNSVVVTVSGVKIDEKIGFRKNGWLFFDEYSLSLNGEVLDSHTVKSYDTTRNVISGNTIEEYCFAIFSPAALLDLDTDDTAILRFTNSDSKENYDHTLSKAEKNSLYCATRLESMYYSLDILLRNYLQAIS